MNLYLLTQHECSGYDTYDSCVVVARTLEDATKIHPGGGAEAYQWCSDCWARSPEKVNAEYLGRAAVGAVRGVVCASFNAG